MIPHPDPLSQATYSAVELLPTDDCVVMLDQRRLPHEETYLRLTSAEDVAVAIETMAIRGAPAIGIAAAYGVVLSHGEEASLHRLLRTRPTAVNLAWAIERMTRVVREVASLPLPERVARLAEEARRIHREDVAGCRAIGRVGAARIPDGATIATRARWRQEATGRRSVSFVRRERLARAFESSRARPGPFSRGRD